MDKTAITMLLNKDWEGLKLLGKQLQNQIDVMAGQKCPHCDGSNVEVGNEGGVCYDCKETYDF